VQSLVRVLRALALLVGVWAVLGLVGWATGHIPPQPPEAEADEPEPDLADAAASAPVADAAATPGPDDAPAPDEGPPPLPVRSVLRFTACGPESPPPSLAVLRVVGDPRPELMVGCGPFTQLLVAQRAAPGADLAPVRVVALETTAEGPGSRVRSVAAAAADVDGDSAPDLILGFAHEGPDGDPRGGALYLVRANPTGAFEPPERLAPIAAVAVATGAFKAQPGSSIVALHQASRFTRRPSELWVFGGGPAPTRTAQLRTGVGAEGLAVADMDHDGHLDLVTASAESGRVDVFFVDGSGRFPRSSTLEVAGAAEVTAGDLMGRGEPQILVRGATLALVQHESQETLQARPLAAPEGLVRPRIVDVNGDGRADIVGLVPGRGVVWLEQAEEPLELADRDLFVFPASPFVPHAVELADLDADGRLDAILVGRTRDDAPWELLLVSGVERGARLELASEALTVQDAPLTLQLSLQ
jgi:hypothetical protein